MKKTFFIFFTLFFSVALSMAQTNPKPGYIITNAGDTVRGILDFRTNQVLSKKCVFQANGESESKTYKPGEIESFRFDHNGKYFVTRRLNIFGAPELYFAEFMVQGMMNLYCVADKYDEYFFFEREDGEMEMLTNRSHLSSSSLEDENERLQEKKEQFGRVKILLQNSLKAADDMNKLDMTRKELVNVVRDYHKDVCTDGGTCIVYEYKEEADKVRTHFKAFAGYAYYSHERTVNQYPYLRDENYAGSTFEIGLGMETDIDRVMRGGSIEMGIAYSPKATFEHDVMVVGGHEPSHTMYEKGRLTISVGAVKRFGKGKIVPLARVGGFYVFHHGNKETRYYMSNKVYEQKWGDTSHFGLYLGGGVQMAVGKHYARLHADWYKSLEESAKGNMMRWGLTAEFAL
jgi:hypothetical protein